MSDPGRWRLRFRSGGAAMLLLFCAGSIAACGVAAPGALSAGASPAHSAGATAGPSQSVPVTVAPSPAGGTGTSTTPPPPSLAAVVSYSSNGQTISLKQGQVLQVVLSSTYWKINGSSDLTVLGLLSGPVIQPQPSGCVPGQGCGTVTAVYRAVADGQARVTASRSVCGEAMGCTTATSQFVVYVTVQ